MRWHELDDSKMHRRLLNVALEPVGIEEFLHGLGLLDLERPEVEVGRGAGVHGRTLLIQQDELHPKRDDAWLPVPAGAAVANCVLQRDKHADIAPDLVRLVYQNGAALQHVTGFLQRHRNRRIEQAVGGRDQGGLGLAVSR
jgi:hypothetical protein